MPFIPHTPQDIKTMLNVMGATTIESLFDEIPASLRQVSLNISAGLSEMALNRFIRERVKGEGPFNCFIGAGAYDHHIPAAVWEIAARGEFYSAYTPYQAEASQGSLQLIYEYQTMMANLMKMEVSNASLYDGASALAEAVLMAVRLWLKKNAHHKGPIKVVMPKTVHPFYRQTVMTIVKQQNISFIDIPYHLKSGKIERDTLPSGDLNNIAAFIIPQPNFFGVLEDVDALTNWADENHIFSIAVVNPIAMALLKPPGSWGKKGTDIACGEGQPLGIPLSGGGPYYGFLCSKKEHIRQMPGRLVGRTKDREGREGYVLTLQAREQHIRRGKATSNICTNQGLMVTASTIYMSLLGPKGLYYVAKSCHARLKALKNVLLQVPGIKQVFSSPLFHEIVIGLSEPADSILKCLARKGIQGGISLKTFYPELGESLLLCVTETKTTEDILDLKNQLTILLDKKKRGEDDKINF